MRFFVWAAHQIWKCKWFLFRVLWCICLAADHGNAWGISLPLHTLYDNFVWWVSLSCSQQVPRHVSHSPPEAEITNISLMNDDQSNFYRSWRARKNDLVGLNLPILILFLGVYFIFVTMFFGRENIGNRLSIFLWMCCWLYGVCSPIFFCVLCLFKLFWSESTNFCLFPLGRASLSLSLSRTS